jgi:peptidoglycan hydrolase-like protein with peptidoglycan-binding domain
VSGESPPSSAPAPASVVDLGQPSASRVPLRRLWLALAAVVAVAVVVVALTDPFGGGGGGGREVNDDATSLASVKEQPLSSQTTSAATLGFAGSYSLINRASGTLTWLPAVGHVVHDGGVLYRVNQAPVILLAGELPFYRVLSLGMTGADVLQLNRDLVGLGYGKRTKLSPTTDRFTAATLDALEAFQKRLKLRQTGTLAPRRAVFLPLRRFRVTSVGGALGAAVGPGSPLLRGSSERRTVSLQLDAAEQADVAVGDRVTITLANDSTTPGVVSSIGTVATAEANGGSPTVAVTVRPLDPAATGSIDQAPVDVAITTASVKSALVVPVDSLLALAGGGYAVEEVSPGGRHHLAAVSLGLFDDADGLVQVTGSGIAAGQRVVVPAL